MSTKIYNGFRMDRIRNLKTIHEIVDRFRSGIHDLAEEKLSRLVVFSAMETLKNELDPSWKGKNPEADQEHAETLSRGLYSAAVMSIMDRQLEVARTQRRDPVVDVDFDLSFFPYGGGVLGMVFSEMKAGIDLWMLQPEVRDYSYWNNTDRPDECSDREWAQRRQAWDHVLKNSSVPAEQGLSISISSNQRSPLPPIEKVLETAKIIDSELPNGLLGKIAERLLVDREWIHHVENTPDIQGRLSEFIRWHKEFHSFLQEMEGQSLLAKTIAEVQSKIPAMDRDLFMNTSKVLSPSHGEMVHGSTI